MPSIWGEAISGLTVIGVVIWLLEHPYVYDNVKAGLIKPFIKGGKRLQKHFIASNVQGKLNKFSHDVAKEMGEKKSYKARVKWVKLSSPETFFKQNRLVIRMDCGDNASKNLTIATLAYVSSVIIRKARPYVDTRLSRAIDLISTRKVIEASAEDHEKLYYNNVFLFPMLEVDGDLKIDCEGISALDKKGYFTRLFLRELRYVGEILHPTIPNDDVRSEIREFLEYLLTVANAPILHEGGKMLEPSQFLFMRRYLKVQVVLFAMSWKAEVGDIRPYRKRIKQGLKQGVEIFYVLASEESFEFLVEFEKDINRRLVKQRILKKTGDRTFYLWKSERKREKHRCLIYQRLTAIEGIEVDVILEEL